jgi:hypothetical protein
MSSNDKKLRIFTWHIHGSYLYYLSQANIDFYIPVKADLSEGYVGRGSTFPFGENVKEVPVFSVKDAEFDCIIFQTAKNYQSDQFEILSEQQRQLPRLFLEHDPTQGTPTDTHHVVNDPAVTVVHVTNFNK